MTKNMKKNSRSLEAILRDLQETDREHIFKVGDLLNEAKATHPGEFLDWLTANYDRSADSAERYMKVARLAERFRALRNLNLPRMTLYALAALPVGLAREPIEIFAKLGRRRVKKSEADVILEELSLRRQHGDYPLETLRGLSRWWDAEPMTKAVAQALRERRPETAEAAKTVILDAQREFVAKLYAEHGPLPAAIPADGWKLLRNVASAARAGVLTRLIEAEQPLTRNQIWRICYEASLDHGEAGDDEVDDDEGDEDDGLDEFAPGPPPPTALGLARKVDEGLRLILEDARGEAVVGEIGHADVLEAIAHVKEQLAATIKKSKVMDVIERAEARSRQNKSADERMGGAARRG